MSTIGFDFPLVPAPYEYRPLKRGVNGWDTYGLQRCLQALGRPLPKWGADGYFGEETEIAVIDYQHQNQLLVDGIAGVVTQRHALLRLAKRAEAAYNLPPLLLKGQLESECAFQVGNYTAQYDNGTYDLGATQLNRSDTFENKRTAFDAPVMLLYLANDRDRGLRPRKDRYFRKVWNNKRAWQLAAGSWNAPSWTDRLANGETLTPSQQAWIDGYISRVTSYVRFWPA